MRQSPVFGMDKGIAGATAPSFSLLERLLAMQKVESSNLFSRFTKALPQAGLSH
jgi:hypothetical protein